MALSKIVASYLCNSGGYDVGNTRLIDQTGLGNHASLASGSTKFTTAGGKSCMEVDSTWYFERGWLGIPDFTVIMAVWSSLDGTDGATYPIWGSFSLYSGPNDHLGATPSESWETRDSWAVQISNTSAGASDFWNSVQANATLTRSAWQILTVAYETPNFRKASINGGAVTVDSSIGNANHIRCLEKMRIGYRATSYTSSGHLYVGEIKIIADAAFQRQPVDLATEIAAMQARFT